MRRVFGPDGKLDRYLFIDSDGSYGFCGKQDCWTSTYFHGESDIESVIIYAKNNSMKEIKQFKINK